MRKKKEPKKNKVGRPSKPDNEMVSVLIYIDPETKAIMKSFGNGNVSEGVRRVAKIIKVSDSQIKK